MKYQGDKDVWAGIGGLRSSSTSWCSVKLIVCMMMMMMTYLIVLYLIASSNLLLHITLSISHVRNITYLHLVIIQHTKMRAPMKIDLLVSGCPLLLRGNLAKTDRSPWFSFRWKMCKN